MLYAALKHCVKHIVKYILVTYITFNKKIIILVTRWGKIPLARSNNSLLKNMHSKMMFY